VALITGARLEATKGRTALEMIRVVRNHLQHADPPIFACTWEDMTGLLNCVPRAAQLAREIRTCAGALPSSQLIELLLQRPVVFRARDPATLDPGSPSYNWPCEQMGTRRRSAASGEPRAGHFLLDEDLANTLPREI
jgi:hypothetical protein